LCGAPLCGLLTPYVPSVPANAIYGSDTPFPTLTGRFANTVPTLIGSDTPFPTLTGAI
jgi:hypothetical protein